MQKKLLVILAVIGLTVLFKTTICSVDDVEEGQKNRDNIKLLVLIIASEDLPVYVELQKIWRAYMHSFPANVDAYFIKGDPNLPTKYQFVDDVIWSQTVENLIPGLINKTVLSLEAMLPKLHQYDYVLRANLSSFFHFPRLLEFL
jgi:hypothetical protein